VSAVASARGLLDGALAGLGLPPWDGTNATLTDVRQTVIAERHRHEAQRTRTELQRTRDIVLAGATLDSLRTQLAALPTPTLQTLQTLPARSTTTTTSPDALDADAADYERTAARLQGELAARRGGAPAIADAEESVVRARAELDRLRRLDRDLELAAHYLAAARDAVHRDIAPKLASALTAVIPALTNNRYRDARVAADTLEVAVRDNDGQWRNAESLSHGTAEQLYLALRVVLAQSLCKPSESPPLIFDDVTAHADPTRRDAVLAWLASLAQHHQVFLFTSDPTLATSPHLGCATVLELGRSLTLA